MFFLFKFFSRKWAKIAEMPALATDIMKKPSAPNPHINEPNRPD
jgi:hypothetical protein